jgi:phosphorylcholine metabolism protein LicD
MESKIIVELTKEEADSLILYRKNQEIFDILSTTGVFNVRNGKVIINFDAQGGLEEIKFDITRYKRGKPILVIHS